MHLVNWKLGNPVPEILKPIFEQKTVSSLVSGSFKVGY